MSSAQKPEVIFYCSFCGKSQHEVRKLIAGPTVFICDECVELCINIVDEEVGPSPTETFRYRNYFGVALPQAIAGSAKFGPTVATTLKDIDDVAATKCLRNIETIIGKKLRLALAVEISAAAQADIDSTTNQLQKAKADLPKNSRYVTQADLEAILRAVEHTLQVSNSSSESRHLLEKQIPGLQEDIAKHQRVAVLAQKLEYLRDYWLRHEQLVLPDENRQP